MVHRDRDIVATLLFTFQCPVPLAAVTSCVRRLPMVLAPSGLTVFPVSDPEEMVLPAFAVVHGGFMLQVVNFMQEIAVAHGDHVRQVMHWPPVTDTAGRRDKAGRLCAAASECGLRGLPEVVVQAVYMTREVVGLVDVLPATNKFMYDYEDLLDTPIRVVCILACALLRVAGLLHRAASLLGAVVFGIRTAPARFVAACVGWARSRLW